jgi:uncharacterized protein YbgA (DUF1722 family)
MYGIFGRFISPRHSQRASNTTTCYRVKVKLRESSKLTKRNKILNVFIYGLFKKTISSSDYLASNGRMISEYKTGGTEGSRYGLLWCTLLTYVWMERYETPQLQKPVSG